MGDTGFVRLDSVAKLKRRRAPALPRALPLRGAPEPIVYAHDRPHVEVLLEVWCPGEVRIVKWVDCANCTRSSTAGPVM